MGSDIHSRAEKRVGGKWIGLDVEAFESRNYGFFGWLAGVRNYSGLGPIAADRGLPKDASAEASKHYADWAGVAHSESWVGVSELLAVDYEQTIEDRRTTTQVGPNLWFGGATCAPGDGKIETLREFLGEEFFVVLKRLQDAEADRVVFWFDS